MHTMNECKGDSLTEQRIQSKITTVVLAIFFVSLLGVGMGQTAVYTLGIPYIDDNVASRESPLYFGENTNSSPFYRFYYIAKKRGQTGGGRGRGAKQGSRKPLLSCDSKESLLGAEGAIPRSFTSIILIHCCVIVRNFNVTSRICILTGHVVPVLCCSDHDRSEDPRSSPGLHSGLVVHHDLRGFVGESANHADGSEMGRGMVAW